MESLKKEITKSELDGGMPLNNHVLCLAHYSNEGVKTKSGIVVGFNKELTFGSDDVNDATSHVADMAEVSLTVYRCPGKLYFNPEDPKSMDWKTEMELQEGDVVWTNPIDALNSVTLVCEGKEYKLINYQDIYVAKRFRPVYVTYGNPVSDAFTINGYVLCQQVHKEVLSDLDVTSQDKIDQTKGIVKYFGQRNARHRSPEVVDFYDIRQGDKVLFDKKCTPFLLERMSYISRFSDEPLWVVPRRQIAMVLERRKDQI